MVPPRPYSNIGFSKVLLQLHTHSDRKKNPGETAGWSMVRSIGETVSGPCFKSADTLLTV
jgi:hypothetical protein